MLKRMKAYPIYRKYYLETNALYQIARIKPGYLQHGFTSVLSLIEIINGISVKNFARTKKVLQLMLDNQLQVNSRLPQTMIFYSFDMALENFKLIEGDIDILLSMVNQVVKAGSYQDLSKNFQLQLEAYRAMEAKWDNTYTGITNGGYQYMKKAKYPKDQSVSIGDKVYSVGTMKDFKSFLTAEIELTRSTQISAVAGMLLRNPIFSASGITEDQLVQSYNGLIDNYIEACAQMSILTLTNGRLAKRNDFTDLLHLVYLTEDPEACVISNDRIFEEVGFKNCIKLDQVLKPKVEN